MSTITTINASDAVSASRTTINTNFSNLNTDKLETSTASSTYAPIASPTFTGTVSGINATMVGLGNVNNTSDVNKPVSTAQQTALDLKANIASPTFTGTVVLPSTTSIGTVSSTEIGYLDGVTSALQTQINSILNLTVTTLMPYPVYLSNTDDYEAELNTELQLHLFNIPQSITFTNISFFMGVGSSGTFKFAIFSEDGQTRKVTATSGAIVSNSVNAITVSSTTLSPGNYWMSWMMTSGSTVIMSTYNAMSGTFDMSRNPPSGGYQYWGKLTVTADTIPSTVTPTSIAIDNNPLGAIFRLN